MYYLLETVNDKETLFIKTFASSKDNAINNFCSCFNAPKNAIKQVYTFDLMFINFSAKTLIKKKLCTTI